MARIFKISGYLVDAVGDYDAKQLEVELKEDYDLIAHHIRVEERDIGEWDDDCPLNYFNCPEEECEKYFDHPADVAPVVRCKDCIHKVRTSDGENNPEDIVCDYFMTDGMDSNDFCSYGERDTRGEQI